MEKKRLHILYRTSWEKKKGKVFTGLKLGDIQNQ